MLTGTYQNLPGESACIPCELGRFADAEGSAECTVPGTDSSVAGGALGFIALDWIQSFGLSRGGLGGDGDARA